MMWRLAYLEVLRDDRPASRRKSRCRDSPVAWNGFAQRRQAASRPSNLYRKVGRRVGGCLIGFKACWCCRCPAAHWASLAAMVVASRWQVAAVFSARSASWPVTRQIAAAASSLPSLLRVRSLLVISRTRRAAARRRSVNAVAGAPRRPGPAPPPGPSCRPPSPAAPSLSRSGRPRSPGSPSCPPAPGRRAAASPPRPSPTAPRSAPRPPSRRTGWSAPSAWWDAAPSRRSGSGRTAAS
jgi:hypothetical protein